MPSALRLILIILLTQTFVLNSLAQSPYFIENINPYITIYDSAAVADLPALSLGVLTYDGGLDTNFFGIVDPSNGFRRILNYPYPNDTLETGFNDLFTLGPINNSEQWITAKINEELAAGNQPTGIESVSSLNSELNFTTTVSMNLPHSYLFNGATLNTTIRIDTHDKQAFELNGEIYFLLIGTHLESFDASESWVGEDSMIVRFTTLHIINDAGNEVARWTPQEQGYRIEDFGVNTYLNTPPNGTKRYSHPHINVINPYVKADNSGVNIFASARHPGTITRLFWDGVQTTLTPVWMFGHPPHQLSPSFYLETITNNQLNTPHGASAFENGDTTYITTYNNSGDIDSVGGRHQVWRVFNDTASLVWQTPDISVKSLCKGDSKWSQDGRFVLTTHGNCDGVRVVDDGNGGTMEINTFEKFNIWNPWTNQKILGMELSGSMAVVLMDLIEDNRILNFNSIDYTITDSIHFTHTHPGLEFWEVGNDTSFLPTLSLPLTYIDSLDAISAWIKTGITGVWRITDKTLQTPTLVNDSHDKLKVSTLHCIGDYQFPQEYQWMAFDMLGHSLPINKIQSEGFYILEARNSKNQVVNRAKHAFIHCY
ncbi:MAG: hypothetical protein K9G41_05975 [Flavobacteriales bacterium]|nr:hypothetical protein [Flavobacteriales bacterium]